TGGAQVWLNGTSVLTTPAGSYALSNNYNTLTLWNDGQGTAYFDDVVVSNSDNGLVVQNPTPNASLSVNALSFGNQYTGTTSTAQSATLTDTGTAALTIGAIGITGTNPGDFAQTNTCGSSLASGASCTISVTFTPSATGSRTANLNVSDNAESSPQSATLIGAGITPPSGMMLSSTSVAFGNQMVGTISASQAITLKNYDATAYSISGISLTGANPGDFAQTNTCGATLASGASCTITLTFAPTATGSRAATLSVADTGPASPQMAALSGTGTPQVPVAGVNPNNLNLGTQGLTTTSAAQSVTLSNTGLAALAITSITFTGANPGDFAQTNTCGGSVAAGASCTISVTFSPTAKGSRGATLNVNDNAAGSPQTVALVGTGSPQQLPAGVYVMDGFEGGNLALWTGPNGTGSGSVETTTVNSGTYAAALTDTSGQYVAINQDLVGGPEAQTYTRFYFNVASGTGTTVLATGTDGVGGNNLWTVIYDQGRAGLDIYLWNGARTRYDLYSNTNIVQPNTWYDVEVQFNEATAGTAQIWLNGVSVAAQSGDLSAAAPYSRLFLNNQATGTVYYDDVKVSNAPNGPVGGAAVSFNPTSLSFASQNAGTTSAAQSVTLTNTGTATMSISGIALAGANAGDFAQTNTCGATLAASATCTVSVTFMPTASGNRTASVQFTDSGFASPQSFALSGTGVAPGVQLNPASLTFSSQQTGTTSAAQTVTLTNTGSASLAISGISVTGANAGDFAQTNTCGATLAASANCVISVTFTPTAGGTRNAAVSIADSVAGSPQTVPLSGTGVVPPPPAGTYLVDGFESGNLSGWTGPNGPGTVAAETTTVHTGTYAAAITCASGQYASLNQTLVNSPGALTYTRFYLYIPSGTATTPIAAGQDANGNNLWVVLYDQGRQGLDTYFWNGARARFDLYSNTNVLTYNTWYEVEIEMNEVTAGHAEVWINGTSAAAMDGDLSAANTYTKLSLQNQTTGSLYFDDVKVSNAPNGPASAAPRERQSGNGPTARAPDAATLPKQPAALPNLSAAGR
ncbi:MAG TPA: choice-of-anchor D domain-containing protein, partial [Ktedonobacterales bacterium]